jgi:alkylation response protein AidB-like acyl-CoA dehydrogenase
MGVHIAYTAEQEALRDELRAYYSKLLDPETRAAIDADPSGPVQREVVRRLGADGWLGIGWPKEYGGQSRGHVDQFLFFDESLRAGAPLPMLTINTVGPTIMQFGTDEQKQRFLPRILGGEIHFCIGYSEPGAGTDLASLRCAAKRDGDEYVINGSKLWTSLSASADYCWLAVRTSQDAKKHRGISIIIVPMDTPGITVQPLELMGESEIAAVHYDDVRVPAENVIGGENNGWKLITNQLNHERVSLCSPGMVDKAMLEVRAWAAQEILPDGSRLIDQEWVQVNLARVHAKLEYLKLANWKIAWLAQQGEALNPADASAIKVYGTEFYMEAGRLLMEVMRDQAPLQGNSPGAIVRGRVERMVRGMHILTFGGGTNEMQRDLISIFGLNMPGSPR